MEGNYLYLTKWQTPQPLFQRDRQIVDSILQLHLTVLQISQYQCKPFTRWKIETEVMLEKDKGDLKIN
jgi:hypothetical protein